MKMHNAFRCKQIVGIPVDAGPIIPLRHAVTALDTLDEIIQFASQIGTLANPGKILKILGINRLW
jgi:hypothetical protein